MHSLVTNADTDWFTQPFPESISRLSSFFAACALNLESPASLCPLRPHGGVEPALRLRPRLFILSPLITSSCHWSSQRHHLPAPSTEPPSMRLINHVYTPSCFGCNTVSSSSLRGKSRGANVFNHCVLRMRMTMTMRCHSSLCRLLS